MQVGFAHWMQRSASPQRVLQRVAEVHLLEVARALVGVALGHLGLVRRELLDLLVVALLVVEELLLEVADVLVVLGWPATPAPGSAAAAPISSLKSTLWPSKSGPSTQANLHLAADGARGRSRTCRCRRP